MVVQNNIPALNSHRNLLINNNSLSRNLERLSSGFRINRASDDAAGLAISERMRGQIRGLSMAEQNTSHAINLIQTAEGGLSETHAIIQRMRELAVQSSNGTFQDSDRMQINHEFQALMSEIDRIASGRVAVPIGAIQIETPVRRKIGEVFDFDEMQRISRWAREREIGLHLDGARLFLASAYSGIPVRQYAALFDTVYVSLYKYFNAASGAILAGPKTLLENSFQARRMFGAGARFDGLVRPWGRPAGWLSGHGECCALCS